MTGTVQLSSTFRALSDAAEPINRRRLRRSQDRDRRIAPLGRKDPARVALVTQAPSS